MMIMKTQVIQNVEESPKGMSVAVELPIVRRVAVEELALLR